ncbi:helix-turn-helix protein [Caballeronia calidae]|uniref:Helix-turn-helix protein n=1 Tax=Caballeronia calidae TaxID=1777139 RepID=A0A158DLE0_9BURK|nr:helix-turn-helix domain-containing protein [Caballeronia calidae]SAK95283.1 helix-turn-helix protein [Caballeronia calidae]
METNTVVHPGFILRQLLKKRNISSKDFATELGESPAAISNIMTGKKSISVGLARKLSGFFADEENAADYTPLAWLTAQAKFDIEQHEREHAIEVAADENRFGMAACEGAREARFNG